MSDQPIAHVLERQNGLFAVELEYAENGWGII